MRRDYVPLTDDQVDAWRSMIVIWRLGFLRLDRTFRKHGLIHLEYGILAVLSDSPGLTMSAGELAELTGLSTSHLSHRLKVMENNGYVTRANSATDRRMVLITLTSTGRALYKEATPEHVQDVRSLMFSELDDDETQALASILAKITGPLTSHPFAAGSASSVRGGSTMPRQG